MNTRRNRRRQPEPTKQAKPHQLLNGLWVGCQHYTPPVRPDFEAARNWTGPEPHEHSEGETDDRA